MLCRIAVRWIGTFIISEDCDRLKAGRRKDSCSAWLQMLANFFGTGCVTSMFILLVVSSNESCGNHVIVAKIFEWTARSVA